uniref:Uncharacterized protein n=1 Tax=Panagrolaimus davidi TaxID=227884 RepID=A0A914QHK4_9BILA
MYRFTAYRISLRKRHQIFENVKVLSFLFPSILIHTILSPLGSIIIMIGGINLQKELPISFFHVFYNLPLLLICIWHIRLTKRLSSNVGAVTSVKDAMGQALPTAQTTEQYFKDLQQQWNT